MQKLAAQFATPEVASVPLAIGDTLAFLQDAGYNEHDHSGMALAYLEKLSAQYGTIAPNMTAIGYNNATFVGFGFGDYDPAPLADSMVDDMKAAFETERNYSLLFSAGRHMVDPIVAGFKEGAAYSPWLQIIAEEVTGQALDMQAQATTDAQAAVVVTGAGVQR